MILHGLSMLTQILHLWVFHLLILASVVSLLVILSFVDSFGFARVDTCCVLVPNTRSLLSIRYVESSPVLEY